MPVEAVVGVEVEAPKKTLTPPITPQNQPPKLMQNDQPLSGGGAIKSVRPPVAPDYVGPVCTADCNQGLQDRVHGEPPKNKGAPLHPDSSESGATSGPRTRPGVHARETGDQGDSLPRGHTGVLLPYLSGGQRVGRLAPDSQFKGVQQIRKAPILSDGDATNSDGLPGRGPPAEAKDLRAI